MKLTRKRLERYRELRKVIEDDLEELRRLRAQALPGAGDFSGLPSGGAVSDRVGELGGKLAELDDKISREIEALKIEREETYEALMGVEDLLIRRCLVRKYLYLDTWEQIAQREGEPYTAGYLSVMCSRWIQKQEQEKEKAGE